MVGAVHAIDEKLAAPSAANKTFGSALTDIASYLV
jgi:hypothetical protein